jgi:hypothetical protein
MHPIQRFRAAGPRLRRSSRQRTVGQGLVEFALVLPVLLLVLLFAIDFGRVFFAVVTLDNAARVGANYAATHPYAWDAIPSQTDVEQQAQYEQVIQDETAGINCVDQTLDLKFTANSLALGDPAQLRVSCQFSPLTPVIGNIFGGPITITAAAVFPIRTGLSDEDPPLPPCFNQTTVPDVTGDKITDADVKIAAASLIPEPIADTTLSPPRNRVQGPTDPVANTCADLRTNVKYWYKP